MFQGTQKSQFYFSRDHGCEVTVKHAYIGFLTWPISFRKSFKVFFTIMLVFFRTIFVFSLKLLKVVSTELFKRETGLILLRNIIS